MAGRSQHRKNTWSCTSGRQAGRLSSRSRSSGSSSIRQHQGKRRSMRSWLNTTTILSALIILLDLSHFVYYSFNTTSTYSTTTMCTNDSFWCRLLSTTNIAKQKHQQQRPTVPPPPDLHAPKEKKEKREQWVAEKSDRKVNEKRIKSLCNKLF